MTSKILKDGAVLTFDETSQSIKNNATCPAPAGTEIVNVSGKIVSPSFVNTHVHMWQTAYRSVGPNVTLPQYFGWISHASPMARPLSNPTTSTLARWRNILREFIQYVEHAHNNWSEKVMEAGYRAAADVRDNFSMEDQWAAMDLLLQRSQPLLLPRLSLDARDFIRDKAAKLDLQVLTLHHLGGSWPQGSTSPTAFCSGNNMHETGLPITLTHAPFLTEFDQQALRAHGLFVSITPESESHYACLGLDTVWTFAGDMISQARLRLQLVLLRNYTKTLDTGRALRRNDIGVIKVGAKADVVVFNEDSPNMLGWSDPVAAVVLHANAGDIEHVLVGVEWRKRDFRLVNLLKPWDEVRNRFLEASERIQAQLANPPALLEKLWGVGEFRDVDIVTSIGETLG
ncbi:hypothetical protein BDW69DRAFT_196060 [Aspergillus filifer]